MSSNGATIKGCRALTDSEIGRLSEYFAGRHGGRDLALFMVGVTTGFRISELLSLRVRDVAARGELLEWVTVARQHMKGRHEGRRMPLHPQARPALRKWINNLKALGYTSQSAPLFISRKREADGQDRPISPSQGGRILAEGLRAIGHEGVSGTHCMRKTIAAKTRAQAGGDIEKVRQVLGHRSLASTQAYLASMAEREMEDLVGGLSFGRPAGPLFENGQ